MVALDTTGGMRLCARAFWCATARCLARTNGRRDIGTCACVYTSGKLQLTADVVVNE